MKWFKDWRDARAQKQLRRSFEDFIAKYPKWGGTDKEQAFRWFYQLEGFGESAVRGMLNAGVFGP